MASIPDETESGRRIISAMEIALEEASQAPAHGDVPIGAVLLSRDTVVASRHNERELRKDPTAHAEILVLRDAAATSGSWRLQEMDLIATIEPCAMCAGALLSARVRSLTYAAADPKAGACGSLYNLCVDPRLNHQLTVTSGVLEERAAKLLAEFFSGLRASNKDT